MSITDDFEKMVSERLSARTDPKLHAQRAPEGYRLRGVSTMLDRTGTPVLTWVKTAKEVEDALTIFTEFKRIVSELPALPPVAAPVVFDSDALLAVYPMGDPHLGLMSWPAETGHDSTLALAASNLRLALDKLVWLAPAARKALLINLGDFLHADNYAAETARSGHKLDVDGRWPKVLRTAVEVLIHLVQRCLEKHEVVEVWNEKGNHDDHGAIMLALCLKMFFRDNPRVIVNENPGMFDYARHGRVLIGSTHGHTVKAAELEGVMASDRAEDWGATRWRYWYTGHVHHESVKEYRGCLVETFNTLAARDAWHTAQGYRAQRSMKCDVMHADRGRIIRHTVGIEELEIEHVRETAELAGAD